jgi:autotransporter-associated beta strand protein
VKIASSGSGAWYFSALNTYINATTIVSGTLQINTIRNANTAGGSSLGNPNVANSVIAIDAGGTLQYTGSTLGSSNRVINMASAAGGTFTLDASGSATFALSGGVTTAGTGAHTSTLVLTGTGAGSESGTIVNGASSNITALTKSGGGTWTLIGTKTYSGATTIQGGTLALSATANNVPNSSKIIVGDTSVGSAILDVTSITTGFKVAAGQVIAGNGTVSGNLTLTSDTAPATGAIISAGSGNTSSDTVGSLILSGAANAFGTGSTGTQVTYDWKLANAATAAGAGYDTLAVTGLSVGNVVDVVPIALSTAAGSFDSSTNYTWDIVSGTGAGTLAGKFQLDTSGLSSFASTLGVSPSSFSIVDDMGTGDVAIQYSGAPEPTSMMLLTVGLAGVAVLRRRRVAVKDKSSNGCKVQNELSQMR